MLALARLVRLPAVFAAGFARVLFVAARAFAGVALRVREVAVFFRAEVPLFFARGRRVTAFRAVSVTEETASAIAVPAVFAASTVASSPVLAASVAVPKMPSCSLSISSSSCCPRIDWAGRSLTFPFDCFRTFAGVLLASKRFAWRAGESTLTVKKPGLLLPKQAPGF